jgi:ferredoxin-NADP reductase
MAATRPPVPASGTGIGWQIATITRIRDETPRVKSFAFALPAWTSHRAGQHYDLRLTARDGYVAQRSYSIASAPEREGEIEVTVERVDGGEVSSFLHDVAVAGDRIELRGPIGGYFVWDARTQRDPLLLIAGGSGVVPLMSMLRHRGAATAMNPVRLLSSSRSLEDVIYKHELDELVGRRDGVQVFQTLTRAQPAGWTGYARRIDDAMLRDVTAGLDARALSFICGPTALVESAAGLLQGIGFAPERIKTERFGPSGT